MKRVTLSFIIALSYFSPASALTLCIEPLGSFIWTPTKPAVPWCVNEWNNTHTCADWEIQSYYSDLENYQWEVDRFVRKLNDYVESAVEYAKCRAKEVE